MGTTSARRFVYAFEDGDASDKMLLGGKGANLCAMTQMGLEVPPGFVITTEACLAYLDGGRLPEGLMREVRASVAAVEEKTGKVFGRGPKPLLVSVRSGSAMSMPGMMDTVLNLGLNAETREAMIRLTGDRRFVMDSWRRFIQLFGKIVLGVPDEAFDDAMDLAKRRAGARQDVELGAEQLERLAGDFLALCNEHTGRPFPEDPYEQLELAVCAVFRSWMGKRAVDYRREFKITKEKANGTAVSICTMVFGNMGNDSATGVGFTRNPGTGENVIYGEYLTNAQGEDVVAGIRTPKPIAAMEREMPRLHGELMELRRRLERHFGEVQDFEFTIEKGKLYCLQTRNGKLNARATVITSVEMLREGLIDRARALSRINPMLLEQLLVPQLAPTSGVSPLARGLPASPGAGSGKIVFDADTAEARGRSGEDVVLVREETKPEDIHGFFAARAILTSRGGKTSHAAVVARGMGKPCVSGCGDLEIDVRARAMTVAGVTLREGEVVTVDGSTGAVYRGVVPTKEADVFPELLELLSWADETARLEVFANADTARDAAQARKYGAKGIGLCRTERMFNDPSRLPVMQRLILAETAEARKDALATLLEFQRGDFVEIFRAMAGLPVTVRLLDPPMHEFLPAARDLEREIGALREGADTAKAAERELVLRKVRQLTEVNPMLGHRGVRLGVTFPEIYEMQLRAILEAAATCAAEGIEVKPEIMVPQVAMEEELLRVRASMEAIREEVESKRGVKLDVHFGTMMEVVRACMRAGELAKVAEFFSFGTNDLTQATFSFSREDAENKFLPQYIEAGLLRANPFEILDRDGVGRLMTLAVEMGRATKPDLVIGICGEHGGQPDSIAFCHGIGLDYVSCSAPRVPIARLAAAQATLTPPSKR